MNSSNKKLKPRGHMGKTINFSSDFDKKLFMNDFLSKSYMEENFSSWHKHEKFDTFCLRTALGGYHLKFRHKKLTRF